MNINKLAKKYGTPLFIIDLDKIKDNFLRFKKAFPESIIAYSYKTNFHPEILKMLNQLQIFTEVISDQEIFFAKKTGANPNKIIYNGLGRQEEDFKQAILKDFFSININSFDELQRISKVSKKLKKKIKVGFRMSPKIKIEKEKTFMENSKFGIKFEEYKKALEIVENNPFLDLKIIFANVGTNIANPQVYVKSFNFLDKFAKSKIPYIDLGGGFASESILRENKKSIFDFGKEINKINNKKYKLIFEPGRYIVEDACYCITKILSINNKSVILDIAGNFLIPLANANYRVLVSKGNFNYNFGGNLCFGSDIIQENVKTKKLSVGKIMQINNAGAYTFSMKNNLGYSDPTILIKKNNKLIKYREKGNPGAVFKNMLNQ